MHHFVLNMVQFRRKKQLEVNFPSTQTEAQWAFFDASKVGLNLGDLSDLRTQESPESSGFSWSYRVDGGMGFCGAWTYRLH